MRLIACAALVGLLGLSDTVVLAGGCGNVDASSKCPGCTSAPGSYGCACNGSTGNCQDAFGHPPTAYVFCKWNTWTWTADEDGDLICADLKVCYQTSVCQRAFPSDPRYHELNSCSVFATEVMEYRYYVYDTHCFDR